MAEQVLIVTGAPGAGKTTVAARLAAEAERSVHLEADWFFRFLAAGKIPPYDAAASRQNETVMDATARAARTFAQGGYLVVWDGIVGPWYLDRVLAGLGPVAVHYVVLRVPLDLSIDRIEGRGSDVEGTGVRSMHPQFADLGVLERHVVDARSGLDDVVDRVRERMMAGALRLAGPATSE